MIVEIIAATVLVSLISLVGVFLLSLKKKTMEATTFVILAFATGSLLGAAFLHLIPEMVEGMEPHDILPWVVASMLLFYLLEHLLHWHHEHHDHTTHEKPLAYLVLLGDGVHNFFDGIAISAAFLTSPEIGITATIAIMLHEIPQEVSDFTLLIYAGFSRAKALATNLLSGLTAVLGAISFFYLSELVEGLELFGLAFAAGGFVYIASTDLLPELHKERKGTKAILQFIAVLAGVLMMWVLSTGHGH
ncbi:MAG: ZIP family metal transporter [Candidatus Micrarchaeota archaeon]